MVDFSEDCLRNRQSKLLTKKPLSFRELLMFVNNKLPVILQFSIFQFIYKYFPSSLYIFERKSRKEHIFTFSFKYLHLCIIEIFYSNHQSRGIGFKKFKQIFFYNFCFYLPSILRCNENLKSFVRNFGNRLRSAS